MTTKTSKRIIARNIKYSAIGKVIEIILQFLLLPFIVSHVGKEVYGAYLLVMTFTGYLGLLDLGVISAVVKYVAEFKGEDNDEKVNKIINASFSFYVVVGLIIAVILFISSFYFGIIFKIQASNKMLVRQLLLVTAAASLFIWPSRTFEGVLRGLQRYDARTIINTATKLMTAIAAYLIFANGYEMVHFLIVSYSLIVLGNVFSAIFGYRYLRSKKIIFPYFSREVFKNIFSFSYFIFLGSLTGIIIFQIDDFVVGAFVSVSAVTLYSAAYMLQQGLRAVSALLGDPLMPAYAEMEGSRDYDKQRMLMFKSTRYICLVFIPLVAILIIFARPLITYWMGEGFEESILPAQVLIAFWFINGIVNPAAAMLTAKGYTKMLFKIYFFNAMLNLALSLLLVRYLGILGVALGTTLSMVLVNLGLLLPATMKTLDIKPNEYYQMTIRDNLIVYALSFLVPYLSLKFYYPNNLLTTLIEIGMVYAMVVIGGFIISFRPAERKEILALIKV